MKRFAVLAAASLLLAVPGGCEGEQCVCTVARPTGELKAHAASFFPKAGNADLDALAACLGDPDPVARDDFAFTLWSEGLRGKYLTPAQMRYTLGLLTKMVAAPDDAAGFHKPFAALTLSEVARADRVEAFLTDAEFHAFAETGASYLRGVRDYRGFTVGEGWRHGVAHGADLLMQLALNPRLSRADADLVLGAVAGAGRPCRIAPPMSTARRGGSRVRYSSSPSEPISTMPPGRRGSSRSIPTTRRAGRRPMPARRGWRRSTTAARLAMPSMSRRANHRMCRSGGSHRSPPDC